MVLNANSIAVSIPGKKSKEFSRLVAHPAKILVVAAVTFCRYVRQIIFVASKQTDRRARFDAVLEQYRGRLGKIALTYAGQESDDLLQEILLQIWRSLPTFEERSSIGTWCYRIAINTAISWRRKADRKRIERSSDSLDQHASVHDSRGQEEAGLLKRFLATLGDVDQAVLLMHLENLSSLEIAESLGVSEGAVRTRMSRLRQKLKTWDSPDETDNRNDITREATTAEVTDG